MITKGHKHQAATFIPTEQPSKHYTKALHFTTFVQEKILSQTSNWHR